ncbi:MAG: carboxypeptidase regulatory-like domain-containing protein [Lewinellaceae bacterium]|nr:carboxypeptidase regulatory-like domain-containing protein [Lewinellaceae bacterium]
MKIILVLLTSLTWLLSHCSSGTSTVLQGKITDAQDGAPLIGATVKLMQDAVVIRGVITDIDGSYTLKLEPGTHTIEVSYTGYVAARKSGIPVFEGQVIDGFPAQTCRR